MASSRIGGLYPGLGADRVRDGDLGHPLRGLLSSNNSADGPAGRTCSTLGRCTSIGSWGGSVAGRSHSSGRRRNPVPGRCGRDLKGKRQERDTVYVVNMSGVQLCVPTAIVLSSWEEDGNEPGSSWIGEAAPGPRRTLWMDAARTPAVKETILIEG